MLRWPLFISVLLITQRLSPKPPFSISAGPVITTPISLHAASHTLSPPVCTRPHLSAPVCRFPTRAKPFTHPLLQTKSPSSKAPSSNPPGSRHSFLDPHLSSHSHVTQRFLHSCLFPYLSVCVKCHQAPKPSCVPLPLRCSPSHTAACSCAHARTRALLLEAPRKISSKRLGNSRGKDRDTEKMMQGETARERERETERDWRPPPITARERDGQRDRAAQGSSGLRGKGPGGWRATISRPEVGGSSKDWTVRWGQREAY